MCITPSDPFCIAGVARAWLCGAALGIALALPAQASFNPLSGPILAASAVAPNVVMVFDNSSSMVVNRIDGETRLQIAREVAKEVISNNRDVRFGLFSFRETEGNGTSRNAPGGQLLVEVGDISPASSAGIARFNALNRQLDAIDPSPHAPSYTYTPLAETYYEVTRYMRGMRAFYPQSASEASREQFSSPIEYRCQKSFGLILTDGLPTYDSEFPNNAGIEPDIDNPAVPGSVNLPNWDGDDRGDSTGGPLGTEGSRFYLNDIARFAYDIDLRNTDRPSVDKDAAGAGWDDPDYSRQNMRTYTLGFALDDARLQGVAEAGGGSYYTASDREQLNVALTSVLQEINAKAGSGGGGVASGPELVAGSWFYRSHYDPRDWSGVLEALSLDAQGRADSLEWTSDVTVNANAAARYQTWRLPQGNSPGAVISLGTNTYARLTIGQRDLLDLAAGDQSGQALLDWSRGVEVSGYRSRTRLLGDVVNSSLVLADSGAALTSGRHAGYADYLVAKQNRMRSLLLAGANDGFLHVLAADTGEHRLAFLPASAHSALGSRARLDDLHGAHVSGVDGAVVVADAPLNGVWSTLAVAGMGAGGRALLALRLFDQSTGNAALGGLWEITPASSGFDELGFSYGKPVIARLNGESVAIVGNGYGGASGQPVLYVIRLSDGLLIRSIVAAGANSASGNGLSSVQVVNNSLGEVIAAYAGDLQGRLWKFDLEGAPSDWRVALNGAPLFTTGLAENAIQPITVQPVVVEHPQGGRMIVFGTGKLMEAADRQDTRLQAVYAVWDRPGGSGNLTAATLQPQYITSESSVGNRRVRTLSQNRVSWNGPRSDGWYLPLMLGTNPRGERVTRNLLVRGGRLLFNTALVQDDGDPCIHTGSGWLMSMDLFSGGMLHVATLDSNDDGIVDSADTPVAGVSIEGGLPGDLVVLEQPRIQPAGADEEANPLDPSAPAVCDAATTFCPCDPKVDDCRCQPGDSACRFIYCGQEYNVAATTTSVDRVIGAGNCRFNRIMWRQLM
ncbi:PilC/PilY family type IV pilus protein [Halopseudomonas pelagia]|uniref:PilC/PilY family type IV pilus protein n=1 Tax=Halopseudomonas pelagia TaxID=553151 RepID=UPI0003A38F5E|nr:PilC/PilY family type IV pilus protein [Halopseudomonas pelagia]